MAGVHFGIRVGPCKVIRLDISIVSVIFEADSISDLHNDLSSHGYNSSIF